MRDSRYSLGEAIEGILGSMECNTPMSIAQIATQIGMSWELTEKALSTIEHIQDFFDAYKILVLKGSRQNVVVLDLRVRMTKLPREVADWFLESGYFELDKSIQTTEMILDMIVPEKEKGTRTSMDSALIRVIQALILQDQISFSELSKRADLNRKTIERVIDVIVKIQDELAKYEIRRMGSEIVLSERPNLYDLDVTRMIYLLKKRYLPEQVRDISKEQERILLQMS